MKKVAVIIRELEIRDLLEITRQIARKHYVTVEELLGRGRCSPEAKARHELWHRLYDQIPSFPKLGEIFDRDHTTILTAVHKYERAHPASNSASAETVVDVACASTGRTECQESAPRPAIKKCEAMPAGLARRAAS